MPDPTLQQGTIAWIEVPDPRGKLKARPVVVVTPTDQIFMNSPLVGVAVTTSVGEKPPAPNVLLPWDPRGRPATRLRRRSAAVCNWLVTFRPSDVQSVEGYVPQKTLLRILQTVKEWAEHGDQATPGDRND